MKTKFLVDTDIILYAIGFTTQDVKKEYIVVSRIENYLTERFADWDGNVEFFLSHSHLFRKDTYPDYKENRKDFVRPKWYEFIKKYMVENYYAVMEDGFEADDLLGIKATEYKKEKYDVVICSRDKDLYQIPGHHYNLYSKTFHFIDEEEAFKWYLIQCLTGDKTDNIPGIHGVGNVKASKLVATYLVGFEFFSILGEYIKRGYTTEDCIKCSELVYIYTDRQERISPLRKSIQAKPS